jgi:putative FmdB family regulatory protein
MPKYDFRCSKCENEWEDVVPASEAKHYAPECPKCGSNFTKLVWLSTPIHNRAKSPYELLDKGSPGGKIFSGPKISSKTSV